MKNDCPCCGSENISGDSVEILDSEARQRIGCADCDSEWVDVYTLSRREVIAAPTLDHVGSIQRI